MNDTIRNLEVKGDRGTFKIKDVVTILDESSYHVHRDVGYESMSKVAKTVMEHIAGRFQVVQTHSYYIPDAEEGYVVEFKPAIPGSRMNEFIKFLGRKP